MSYCIRLHPEIACRGYCVRAATGESFAIAAAGFGAWVAGHHFSSYFNGLVDNLIDDVKTVKRAAGEYSERQRQARWQKHDRAAQSSQNHDAGASLEELAAGVGFALTQGVQTKWRKASEAFRQ
jgi:hypothetical protein